MTQKRSSRKKRAKRPAARKSARRTKKRPVKKAAKRRAKRTAKKTSKRKAKRPARKTAKRKTKRPARKTAKRKAKRTAKKTAKRKTKRPARRKKARPATRRKARKPARRRTVSTRRKKGITRRKPRAGKRTRGVVKRRKTVVKRRKPVSVRRKPAVKIRRAAKKPVRRFPAAPARAARVPRARFSFRKLTSHFAPPVKPPIEAYRGNKPYIFASYSHKNMKEVFAVIKKLADARYRIWYDEGIEPGNEWPEEVGKALSGCQLFVVFMSPTAMESRNVRNEINFASSANKGIMVVNLQPAELSEGMKLQIGTVQFINKHELSDSEFIEKMKRVLDPVLRL